MTTPPMTVALLATPDTTASTLFGMHDLLAGARRDWQFLVNRVEAPAAFRPLIVNRDGQPLVVANGVTLVPHAALSNCRPDIVCVTDLMVPPWLAVEGRYDDEVRWLRACHADGATIASACSGAVLVALTGLLDGLEAATHWGYCDELARRHPSIRWHADKPLVTAGNGHRLLMAGGGTNWHALALYLIARHVGAQEAMQVARLSLIDWDATSPLAYAALARSAQWDDPVIARCQEWAAHHYRDDAPVAAMTRLSGLPERTFQRRFSQATGRTPLDYVHTLRLEEAKQLLEAEAMPVESIAVDVGYQDTSFFNRLFRRKVGMTPAQYRRRFGRLSRRLAEAAAEAPVAGAA